MRWFALIVALFAVSAHSAGIVYDPAQQRIVQQQGTDQVRSIASLTKLMTAMIVLDSKQSMSAVMSLEQTQASVLPPRNYSRLELLHALLVHSDNAAAETLAHNHPGGRFQFIKEMNARARALGLSNTKFVDPSGLSVFNVSTMQEVSIMTLAASHYELVRAVTTLPWIQLQQRTLPNTSSGLLSRLKNVVLSKTGFTNHAGFCAGMVVMHRGRELVVVVLGEPTKQQRMFTVDQLVRSI